MGNVDLEKQAHVPAREQLLQEVQYQPQFEKHAKDSVLEACIFQVDQIPVLCQMPPSSPEYFGFHKKPEV